MLPIKSLDSPKKIVPSGQFASRLLLSVGLFLLIWEWLRPMQSQIGIGEPQFVSSILIMSGIFLLLNCLPIPKYLGWLIKSLILLVTLGSMFDPAWTGQWVTDISHALMQDIIRFSMGDLLSISSQLRMLSFLICLTVMLHLVQHVMLQYNAIVWFVSLTLLYLAVLQIFLEFDTISSMIRVIAIGLMMAALLHLKELKWIYDIPTESKNWPTHWIIGSILIGVIVYASGQFASQQAPKPLMQPFSSEQFAANIGKLTGVNLTTWMNDRIGASDRNATTGYGEDDSLLGGPIKMNDEIVFTARTPQLTYWRGESKSLYTGSGWRENASVDDQTEYENERISNDAQSSSNFIDQEVMWKHSSRSNLLFSGGTVERIDTLLTADGKAIQSNLIHRDSVSGKNRLVSSSDSIGFYKVRVQPLKWSNASSDASFRLVKDQATPSMEQYVQLPSQFPTRIRELAKQVTAGAVTDSAKAKAIAEYLRTNYAYSLDKPTFPGKSEDFVDHFLFVDRGGYCNHFSSAMVVMLRSIDIPARFVKGFTPGEVVDQAEDGNFIVNVRNRDAHSWVEVYETNVGWISYEPTPGFSMNSGTSLQAAVGDKVTEQSSPAWNESKAADNSNQTGLLHDGIQILIKSAQHVREWVDTNLLSSWIPVVVSSVLLFLIVVVIVFRRRMVRQHRRLKEDPIFNSYRSYPVPVQNRTIVRQMERMWRRIFHKYGSKQPNQTAREYVMSLNTSSASIKKALDEFVTLYEGIKHDQATRTISTQELTKLWRRMNH
ncbi:transglutaminase-like domain-containing protein [Paenibacillus sp. N1-5-1-14]|uniref:transglutaminase-like domain-containing protein n=1 Tax=Paenibacillus radicibacter TaxID=2972488 RepID=UPI002159880A|nr:transglutaminase-like domain-containing protein [Paenibacillus radicibacter]MCR8643030.1 transglutaminase-like domain-containing protein [Paenibacillus radicibacter]